MEFSTVQWERGCLVSVTMHSLFPCVCVCVSVWCTCNSSLQQKYCKIKSDRDLCSYMRALYLWETDHQACMFKHRFFSHVFRNSVHSCSAVKLSADVSHRVRTVRVSELSIKLSTVLQYFVNGAVVSIGFVERMSRLNQAGSRCNKNDRASVLPSGKAESNLSSQKRGHSVCRKTALQTCAWQWEVQISLVLMLWLMAEQSVIATTPLNPFCMGPTFTVSLFHRNYPVPKASDSSAGGKYCLAALHVRRPFLQKNEKDVNQFPSFPFMKPISKPESVSNSRKPPQGLRYGRRICEAVFPCKHGVWRSLHSVLVITRL